jgi:hypothetical protein
MNTMKLYIKISILVLTTQLAATPSDMLDKARDLFYISVEKQDRTSEAIDLFEKIAREDTSLVGVSQTYIGALTALKAKYSFWPHQKLSHAKKGLSIMEAGIKKSSSNIEALFIYGSTCHYLPFFFNKGDEAQKTFVKIADLLPEKFHNYDSEMILNVVDFLLEKAELGPKNQENIQSIRIQLLADGQLVENSDSIGGS